MSEEDLIEITTKTQVWRKELKVGDKVDVQVVGDDKKKTQGWLQGEISEVEDDLLSVIFPKSTPDYDTSVSRWSNNLMQIGSMTKEDHVWRAGELEEGKDVHVDVHDKFNWEPATIFQTRIQREGDRQYEEAFIAFRIYEENGKKEDARGKFNGWTSKFDEWIPLYSPRIMKY